VDENLNKKEMAMERIVNWSLLLFAAILLLAGAVTPVAAQDAQKSPAAGSIGIFNFESDALGLPTKFVNTVSAVRATFSSPDDPGGFEVASSFFAPPMTGNVLYDPGESGASFIPLTISFDRDVDSIYVFFGTDGQGAFNLTAYENST
jgi:hypothetical protein